MEKDVKGHLKKEVEGLVFATEEQAPKTKIDEQKKLEKLNICEERDDPVTHLIAELQVLAQKQYKQRHDNIASIVQSEVF